MTEHDLSSMEALSDKASAAPWHCSPNGIIRCLNLFGIDKWPDEGLEQEANCVFVTASRTFVPQAIAEIRRQGTEVTRLRALVEKAYHEGCRDGAQGGESPWSRQYSFATSDAKRALDNEE